MAVYMSDYAFDCQLAAGLIHEKNGRYYIGTSANEVFRLRDFKRKERGAEAPPSAATDINVDHK